jgi:hypothetical protein
MKRWLLLAALFATITAVVGFGGPVAADWLMSQYPPQMLEFSTGEHK